MADLTGKTALVTGSTRGLGEAIANTLARSGAATVVTGRNTEDGARVVGDIRSAGGTAEFVHLDLADESSVRGAFEEITARFGRLDVLVNNAAPTEFVTGAATGDIETKIDDDVTHISTEAWHKITRVGIDGLMWTLKYGIPVMLDSGGGSIVNISSVASIRGTRGVDGYTACKGAMNALTLSTAVNYQPTIRSNCLVAGAFLTPGIAPLMENPAFVQAFRDVLLTPSVGLPDQMAETVAFLASDAAAYITGQILPIDGGLSVAAPVPKLAAPIPGEAS